MPLTTQFLLDMNLYGDLSDPTHRLHQVKEHLRESVRADNCRVFGSTYLLGEFAGWARREPAACQTGIDLFWELCGGRIFLPWKRLSEREIRKGGQLSREEACLTPPEVSSVRSGCDLDGLCALAEQVAEDKDWFAESFRAASREAEALFRQKWTAQELKEARQQFAVDEAQIQGWFESLAGKDQHKLRLPDDRSAWPRVATLPVWRSFVSIHLALIKAQHRNSRKYQPADSYDAKHYIHAGLGPTLVTADKGLRRVVRLIEWKPNRVIDEDEFALAVANF